MPQRSVLRLGRDPSSAVRGLRPPSTTDCVTAVRVTSLRKHHKQRRCVVRATQTRTSSFTKTKLTTCLPKEKRLVLECGQDAVESLYLKTSRGIGSRCCCPVNGLRDIPSDDSQVSSRKTV